MDFFVLSKNAMPILIIIIIAVTGYILGAIKVKGVSLGSAGVFIMALVAGHFMGVLEEANPDYISAAGIEMPKIIQNLGLVLFVTAVGFIAGPNFFKNLKKNAKSYVLLGFIIIFFGALVCSAVVKMSGIEPELGAGLLSGALTSSPGFSAAKEAAALVGGNVDMVSVGYGIGYPFGVIGVVLFVQLIPKILKVNMADEVAKISAVEMSGKKEPKRLYNFMNLGFWQFMLAMGIGILLGSITIPLPNNASFSLGMTGGPLIAALIIGHFGHIGRLNLSVEKKVNEIFREFGLMLFLIGAGVEGGRGFVRVISQYGGILFVYGAIMTIIPMIIGFFLAKYLLKIHLLDNLGSICGGMTSTPSLGVLIKTSGTDDVANAYAATYPIALICVVLACQFVIILL